LDYDFTQPVEERASVAPPNIPLYKHPSLIDQ